MALSALPENGCAGARWEGSPSKCAFCGRPNALEARGGVLKHLRGSGWSKPVHDERTLGLLGGGRAWSPTKNRANATLLSLALCENQGARVTSADWRAAPRAGDESCIHAVGVSARRPMKSVDAGSA